MLRYGGYLGIKYLVAAGVACLELVAVAKHGLCFSLSLALDGSKDDSKLVSVRDLGTARKQ